MVVALSPASTASQNVLDEISFALEKNKKIIPIVYRTCDIPFRLKRLQYIDFSVDYRAAFTSLLVALNVTPPGTSLDIAEGIQKPIGNPPRELSSRKETRFSDDGPRGEPYTDLRTTTEKTTRIFTRERIIAASLGFLISALSCLLVLGIHNWGYLRYAIFEYQERLAIFVGASGSAGVVAGAITGGNRRRITVTIGLAFVIGFFLVGLLPVVIAWPIAVITALGAAVGLEKLRRPTK